jgi:hypothetical protein
MLLVAITLIDSDWVAFQRSIIPSIGNFEKYFGDDVFFYFVLQTKGDVQIDVEKLGVDPSQVDVSYVAHFSVSAARNRAIDFGIAKGFDSIIFHDASILYAPKGCAFFHDNYLAGLARCRSSFSESISRDQDCETSYCARVVRVGGIHTAYVWTYCFPLRTVCVRFDERFGPGESTRFKCGEDVLFIRAYLKANKIDKVLEMSDVGVLHPPRPSDFSKHLAYAFGQGKLHRTILLDDRSPAALLDVVAFFGNALLRVILLRRNARQILKFRIAGFLHKD